MADSDNESTYYIRIKGRVFGPYSVKQLDKLRSRGQFGQSNEISANGQTWEPASTLDALFGVSAKMAGNGQSSNGDIELTAPTATQARPWYYSIDGQQNGPVALNDLQQMLDDGQLNLNDLVWKEGLADWAPAADIPELNRTFSVKSRTSKKSTKQSSGTDALGRTDDIAPHFLDHVLKALRSIGGESFIWVSGPGSVEVGRYLAYVAIILNLVFCFVYATKFNSVNVGIAGVTGAMVGLVLQYSAVKSCGAITRLIRATTLRMSSTAFLDSMVFIFLVGGIVALAISSIIWIRMQEVAPLVVGIVVFLLCEQLGLLLLHPGAIGITISDRASPGEEAIALLSFYMMLPLRSVASVFAIGLLISVVGTFIAFCFLFTAKQHGNFGEYPDALKIASGSAVLALGSAAFPLVLYVYFVTEYLMVDILRAILVIPHKLDQLATKVDSTADDAKGGGTSEQRQLAAPATI